MYLIDLIISPWLLAITFPILLFLAVLFFFTGKAFIFFCNRRQFPGREQVPNNSVFWSLFIGFLLIISIYAIAVTNFQSVLLPIPFFLFLFVRTKAFSLYHIEKHKSDTAFAVKKKLILIGFISLFIYWLYQISGYISFNNDLVKYIDGDTEYYGRAGMYLNYAGKENESLDYLNLSNIQVQPYHYGDLWLIAFIHKVCGINSVVITSTIAYPFFACLFIIGLAEYVTTEYGEKLNKVFIYLIIILAGFISAIKFIYPSFFLNADIYSLPLLKYPKLFLLACILISMLSVLRFFYLKQFVLISCIGAITFINIAPAIIIYTSFVLLFSFFSKPLITTEIKHSSLILCSTICFLIGFYFLFGEFALNDNGNSFSFETAIHILLGGLLQFIPLMPFFLLLIFTGPFSNVLKKIKCNNEIIFLIMFSLAGLISYSLLYNVTPEAVQFFSNVFVPASAIIVVLICIRTSLLKSLFPRLLVIVLLLLACSKNFGRSDDSYISTMDLIKTKQFLKEYSQNKFVNFRSPDEFESIFKKNTVFSQPLSFLSYLTEPYTNVTMDVHKIKLDSSSVYFAMEKTFMQQSPFIVYQSKRHVPVDKAGYNFIREFNIRMITVSPLSVLPEYLKPFVSDSIALSGGWKIYYAFKK